MARTRDLPRLVKAANLEVVSQDILRFNFNDLPTGYKIVRVHFKDGKPVGGYENFLTGFWVDGTNPAQVWGRPVGLATAKDGSLLIADDVGQRVWRVSWVGG